MILGADAPCQLGQQHHGHRRAHHAQGQLIEAVRIGQPGDRAVELLRAAGSEVTEPSSAWWHVVKAFVVPAGGLASLPDEASRAARAKELQDHVKSVIAPYKYPRVIEFVDTLPRTSSGKLQRFKLRQLERQKAGEPAL